MGVTGPGTGAADVPPAEATPGWTLRRTVSVAGQAVLSIVILGSLGWAATCGISMSEAHRSLPARSVVGGAVPYETRVTTRDRKRTITALAYQLTTGRPVTSTFHLDPYDSRKSFGTLSGTLDFKPDRPCDRDTRLAWRLTGLRNALGGRPRQETGRFTVGEMLRIDRLDLTASLTIAVHMESDAPCVGTLLLDVVVLKYNPGGGRFAPRPIATRPSDFA
ncbi:hypothetical protein OHR68_34635 [Spirillospora sp. NBC_00431]